jgi:hypothetical protein
LAATPRNLALEVRAELTALNVDDVRIAKCLRWRAFPHLQFIKKNFDGSFFKLTRYRRGPPLRWYADSQIAQEA